MSSSRVWIGMVLAVLCLMRAQAEPARVETLVAETSTSPVDVIYPEQLQAQGYTTLPQLLANLVPSFVYPEPALAHGTDHARPAGLRGLAPDQVVVLVNGKRRNPAAWLHRDDTYGRGSQGVDLSVIPLSAVARVEILLDGASARYGSGAIAGAINVVLKDATDGGSLIATFGQYRTHFDGVPDLSEFNAVSPSEFTLFERGDLNTDDGEGDTRTLSIHGGFSLFEDGYLDLAAEFRDQDPTNRSGFDPRRIYPDLPNGDWDPREAFVDRRTHRFGNPEQEDVNLLANFGMPLSARTDFYGFVGYSARNSEAAGRFVRARDPANVAAVHPDGYLPLIESDAEDRYFTLGLRGQRWGWNWDLGFSQDEHETDWSVADSLNASLGDISPTGIEVGNYEGRHAIFTLDLDRGVDLGLAAPVTLAFGLESRDAEYENEFGDRASYIGQLATTDDGVLRPPGAQGLYGVRPFDDFDDALLSLGGYLNVHVPWTASFDTELGLRFDDQEDNSDLSAKLGARWRATDRLTLRATVSRDFRSPSPAQTYFLATEQVVDEGVYAIQGTYPADHPVAEALGAEALDSETALNVSAGGRYRFGEDASVEINVYQIDVDDRIVLSDYLRGPALADALAVAGISGVESARVFLNGVDTRTRGLDLIGSYRWQSVWGPVELQAGLNLNDIEVTDVAATPAELAGFGAGFQPFGTARQTQLERWTPDSKLHLSATWHGERLSVTTRLIRYGEVTDVGDEVQDDLVLDPEWLLDLHTRYQLTDTVHGVFGVHNLLDAYSEARPREASDPVENRFLPYSNYAPFGFNGRFVYLRLGVELAP